MTRRIARVAAFAATALALVAPLPAQQATFRSTTAVVSVSVSVKRGNNVVANLKAADFILTDDGVPQTVEAVSIESVPVDVTLFLDTSGSTAGKLDDMRHDVQTIQQLLRAGDRFRLLTIGDAVSLAVPWVPAGTKVPVSIEAVGGISLIHDALMFGLVHRPEPGRRHLVVGMTDRHDCGSVVPASLLLDVAAARRRRGRGVTRSSRTPPSAPVASSTGSPGSSAPPRSPARSRASSTTSGRATCCATRQPASRARAGMRSPLPCPRRRMPRSVRGRGTTDPDPSIVFVSFAASSSKTSSRARS